MVTAMIVTLSVVLGLLIVGVEGLRPPPKGHIDFLRATSAVYFICFVVLPLYLQIDHLQTLRGGEWSWLLKRPFDDPAFAYAIALALVGYGCIILGFYLGSGFRSGKRGGQAENPGTRMVWRSPELVLVGGLLGLAGLICLVVYTKSIGGLGPLILQAALFRSATPPVVTPFAFLKTLAPMVIAGTFLIHSVRARNRLEGQAPRYGVAFYTFLVASLLVLFHQAGRFPLAAFLLTFPLAQVIRTGRVRAAVVAGGSAVILAILLFGKQLFQAALTGTAVSDQWALVGQNVLAPVRLLMVEFAFPVATLANATVEVPAVIPFRWFFDVPLALVYLIPQRLLGVVHDPTVSMVNTGRFAILGGVVPVDLVSFGYFSAGILGVVMVLVAFGGVLAWLGRLLPATKDPVDCVLRAAWILFVALRVMYGDPQLIWPGGLHLLIMAALLMAVRILVEEDSILGRVSPAPTG